MTPDSDLQLSLEECPRIVEPVVIGNLDKNQHAGRVPLINLGGYTFGDEQTFYLM